MVELSLLHMQLMNDPANLNPDDFYDKFFRNQHPDHPHDAGDTGAAPHPDDLYTRYFQRPVDQIGHEDTRDLMTPRGWWSSATKA